MLRNRARRVHTMTGVGGRCGDDARSWKAARVRGFGTTIFAEMSALAARYEAVNLGQGFPNFPAPGFVKEAGRRAIAAEQNQYARSAGCLPLVTCLAEELSVELGREIDPLAEVTVTAGATYGLFAAFMSLVDPGDEVILIEPFYDSYPADCQMAGGRPVYVPLRPSADGAWRLDPEELKGAFGPSTRMLVLNTPHNPTGKVFSRAELEELARLCIEHDVLVLTDEVYDRLWFDGEEPVRMASLPGMWDRTVTLGSAGKTFGVTGWKVGWAIAPSELSAAIRSAHQWMLFSVATPLQEGIASALRHARESGYYGQSRRLFQGLRDRLVAVLSEVGLNPVVPRGAYFVMADITGRGFEDDLEFCRWMTAEVGVTAIPTSPFYGEDHRDQGRGFARFCFAKDDQTLEEAARRLRRGLGKGRVS